MSATTDTTTEACEQLTGLACNLTGHGFTPQPTGLLVRGESDRTTTVLCELRADDGNRLWYRSREHGWLAEADRPETALTALKGLLNGELPNVGGIASDDQEAPPPMGPDRI